LCDGGDTEDELFPTHTQTIINIKIWLSNMSDNKIRLPASYGGIMQYYDEFKSKIELSPYTVIILAALVIIFVAILHKIGPSIFGF
jgi:preprotein translocase subunit Sec61beta